MIIARSRAKLIKNSSFAKKQNDRTLLWYGRLVSL